MTLTFLVVGKLSKGYLKDGCDDFLTRLGAFAKVTLVEVPEVALKNPSPSEITKAKEKASQALLSKLPKGYVIACDLKGKSLSSEGLAKTLNHIQTYQDSHVIFVVGGSHGLTETVRQKADMVWSLSKLTFPHQLFRLILLEQVYRAFTINAHHPYHK